MYEIVFSTPHKKMLGYLILMTIVFSMLAAGSPGVAQAYSEGAASAVKIACERWYSVRAGDTLGKVADRFGITPYQIVNVNKISSPYTIFVEQKLCIPKPAVRADQLKKLSKKFINQGAAYFSAGWSPTGIIIKPSNFPQKSSLLVKVLAPSHQAAQWVKLGVFTTKKGVDEYGFRLPKELRDVHQLTVCLKNVATDLRMCRNLPPK